MELSVWVDADSCPVLVRNYLISYTQKLNLNLYFVANKNIPAENIHEKFKMIISSAESQSADIYIVEHVQKNDIVITRDIPLAKLLVEKNITVLNDRGKSWTKENIGERESERDLSLELACIGLTGSKKNTYSKKEFSLFANCFDREIHRLIKLSSEN